MLLNKISINKVLNISKLISIHANEFDKNFVFNGEEHSDWEMVYVDKGSVEVKRDNEVLILTQGDVIFHRPHEFHSIKSYNSSPNFFVISFECNSQTMRNLDKFYTKLDKVQKSLLSSLIIEAENAYNVSKNSIEDNLYLKKDCVFGSEQLVKIYLEQLLILLIRKRLNITTSKTTLIYEKDDDSIVSDIKSYIKSNINQKISNKDICKYVGYGKTYLSVLFHEKSGYTLNEYINKQKIDLSKELLRVGDKNINEISNLLAFETPQYFCRVFKKFYGMSPSEFKKTLYLNK